jgi:hypothetical protein
VLALGASVPGVSVPGVSVPGVSVPGVSVPGVSVPGVSAPGVPLEVGAPGVPLAEMGGVAGPVRPGENDGGVVGGDADEQADTDAVASMATAAQRRTVPSKRRRP